jgi:tRNA isopentenyl-2-thiomethyl-A-37 hydroxylase MiaE
MKMQTLWFDLKVCCGYFMKSMNSIIARFIDYLQLSNTYDTRQIMSQTISKLLLQKQEAISMLLIPGIMIL